MSILGPWVTHLREAELQGKCFWERAQPQSGLPEMVQPESSRTQRGDSWREGVKVWLGLWTQDRTEEQARTSGP